ncbi:hypothetical protein Emed_000304 [Eimeria media]
MAGPSPEEEQQGQQTADDQCSPEPALSLPESHLLLVIHGCVESAWLGNARGGAICRYALGMGRDWKQLWGLGAGISQEAHCGGTDSFRVTFNFPFQAAFKGTSPYGWPRVAFCLYGRDWLGRQIVAGYAHTAIPVQPGRHQRRLPIYALVESSFSKRLLAWLKAERAEYIDLLTAANTRGLVRAEGVGEMKVTFDVLLKGAEALGYAT